MRLPTFTLAAALLGGAGGAGATPHVPVISLMAPVGEGAAPPDVLQAAAGSFAIEAATLLPLPAGAAALMPATARTRYGALVAARPLPAFGPVLLLLLGCLVYLGRARHPGFSLRPARSLLERSGHAPARR